MEIITTRRDSKGVDDSMTKGYFRTRVYAGVDDKR